ncbi:hypothetical protein VNO77_22527 [Canavalia gladiata]|uniref:Uncharacterized protein n=1 Tax=Canavalia gladiata TaxID=3824 RepID=A0AAN9L463_CANGL
MGGRAYKREKGSHMEGPFGFGFLELPIPRPPLCTSPFSSQRPHLSTLQEEESSPLRSTIESSRSGLPGERRMNQVSANRKLTTISCGDHIAYTAAAIVSPAFLT